MLLDHSVRRDEIPNVVNIAAALSARTKGLEWLDATERTLWRRIVLVERKRLFQADTAEEVQEGSASNGIGGLEERGVEGGEAPGEKQKKRSFLKKGVVTAKVVGAGDDEEDGGLDDAVGDAGASSNYTAPPPYLTARVQAIDHVSLNASRMRRGSTTRTTTTTRAPGRTT